MKVTINGVSQTLKIGDKVVLSDNQTATVRGFDESRVYVKTDAGQSKVVFPEEIIKILVETVEKIAVSLFQRLLNWIRSW